MGKDLSPRLQKALEDAPVSKTIKSGEIVTLPKELKITSFMYRCKPSRIECTHHCSGKETGNEGSGKGSDEDEESVVPDQYPSDSKKRPGKKLPKHPVQPQIPIPVPEMIPQPLPITIPTPSVLPPQVVELPPIILCPTVQPNSPCPLWKAYLVPSEVPNYMLPA